MAKTFEILGVMCDRNMDIRLSTLDNITNMQVTKRGDTELKIGVHGDVLNQIWRGQLVGGLLLANKEQFDQIKAELEAKENEGAA